MSRSSLRTLLTAFFLTLIVFTTFIGLAVAAFNTQSAMTPMDTPVSARISEDGASYEISFFDRQISLPRFPVREAEAFVNRHPALIPKPLLFLAYGADCLSRYLD